MAAKRNLNNAMNGTHHPQDLATEEKHRVQQLSDLEDELSHLAYRWRSSPNRMHVEAYHRVFAQMRALGWDGYLDVDAQLPAELMPPEYTERKQGEKHNS